MCISVICFHRWIHFARSTKVHMYLSNQLCHLCVLLVVQLSYQIFGPKFMLSGLERICDKKHSNKKTLKFNSSNKTKVYFPLAQWSRMEHCGCYKSALHSHLGYRLMCHQHMIKVHVFMVTAILPSERGTNRGLVSEISS